MKRKLLLHLLVLCISLPLTAQGFLKRDNKAIVDGNGKNVILRGIGLGGWMLQEGYMLQTSAFASSQHQIRAKIENVIGKENTDTFYQVWLKNYIQKIDVDSIKAYGFNSIRLPLHYNLFTLPIDKEPTAGENTWLETGFALTDSLLNWCKANKIYLILDMHATPGGQGKDEAISDYDPAKPSLWESEANRNKLIALWKKLAARYVNEEWIGAYDLINEINWDFENSDNQNGCNCTQNKPLWDYYKLLITAIREVDKNHLIILEGNCWGNNYAGLGTLAAYDSNLALSFHKYWNYNTKDVIQGLLNLRNTANLPLWCGESGENSNVWYTQAIKLLEENNIGWAWWTYKKFESTSGTNSVKVTPEYKNLLTYWEKGGTKPSVESAKATLMKIADNLKIENCIINTDVVDAMIRQVQTAESKPFRNHKIPGTIFSKNYDYGRVGVAYFDIDTANYNVSTGTYKEWNTGWSFRNDGVDIQACNDTINEGYNVGWTNPGEWLQYTVTVDSTMAYKLKLRYASFNSKSTIHLTANDKNISGTVTLLSTGGWETWKTFVVDNLIFTKGENKIKLHFGLGGINVNYLNFERSKSIADLPFEPLSAYSSENGRKIYLELNSVIQNTSFSSADFYVKADTILHIITSVSKISDQTLEITLADSIISNQVIKISYTGNSIKDSANKILSVFENFPVLNKRPSAVKLPAKIQAENFYRQKGLELEKCTDTGAGQNLAYTSAGDYADYCIIAYNEGNYKVDFRVAAQASGGVIELQLFDDDKKTILGTISVPATGGWQAYTTVSKTFFVPKGQYILRVFIQKPEFNINWFQFNTATSISSLQNENDFTIFPNPAKEQIRVSSQKRAHSGMLYIYSLEGQLLLKEHMQPNKEVSIRSLKNGFYFVKLNIDKEEHIQKLIVKR